MPLHDALHAVRAHADEFIAFRRDIHRHPELPFEEHRTSALVAERLESWGYRVERGLGGTGLVAQLRRKIGALRAAGLPVRAELLQYEDAPAEAGAEDIFDNMPV